MGDNESKGEVTVNYLHHVGIVVADLDMAVRFVTEVLGLEFDHGSDVPQLNRRVAFYRCGQRR